MNGSYKWFGMRLEPDIHRRLKDLAEREYRTMTSQVMKFIQEGLERDEVVYKTKEKHDA